MTLNFFLKLTGILTSLLGILLGGGGGDPNLTFDIFDDSRFIDLDTFLSDDSSKEILEQLFLKRSVGSVRYLIFQFRILLLCFLRLALSTF